MFLSLFSYIHIFQLNNLFFPPLPSTSLEFQCHIRILSSTSPLRSFNTLFTFFSFSELSFIMHTQKAVSFLMFVFAPIPRRPVYYKVSPHIGQNVVVFPKKYNTFNRILLFFRKFQADLLG